MGTCCYLISGLPGSGKTTLGKQLAKHLGLACLDKDDYLENLFDAEGVFSLEMRSALSIKANEKFLQDAAQHEEVVLVSHWKNAQSETASGTPIEEIVTSFSKVVEIYCDCDARLATKRFLERARHDGHMDTRWTFETLLESMKSYERGLPLLPDSIRVDTEGDVSLESLLEQFDPIQ